MSDVAPPATAVWYDLGATVDAVLAVLRLSEGDVDELRIAALVPAAAAQIDAKVDGTEAIEGPPPPADLQAALEQGVLRLYGLQGAVSVPNGFGVVGVPRDALDVSYGLVGPHKRRWGVG